jgi:hypothetical protein
MSIADVLTLTTSSQPIAPSAPWTNHGSGLLAEEVAVGVGEDGVWKRIRAESREGGDSGALNGGGKGVVAA